MTEHYKIILDEAELDRFISLLPDLMDDEVYYVCLFGRHKYCPEFPNTRDGGQLARIATRKEDIKEKLRRMECPVGAFGRDGHQAPQQALAVYMGLNPRCLSKANRNLLIELATRIAKGETSFNPLSVTNTEIHRAVNRKFFVDFDYDSVEYGTYVPKFHEILPANAFKILTTRGGFHLLVELAKVKELKSNWYTALAALPGCDVKGSNTLTPVPGCTQGNFCPTIINGATP